MWLKIWPKQCSNFGENSPGTPDTLDFDWNWFPWVTNATTYSSASSIRCIWCVQWCTRCISSGDIVAELASGQSACNKKGDNKEIRVGPVSLQKKVNCCNFWVQSPKCSLEGCFVNLQRGTTNGLRLDPASYPPGEKTPSVMERRLFYYFKQSQPFVEHFEKCLEKSRWNFFEGNGVQKGRKVRGWGSVWTRKSSIYQGTSHVRKRETTKEVISQP